MFERKDPGQASMWIAMSEIATSPATTFYDRLDRALTREGFGERVRSLCAPFYEQDRSKGGRKGIDPEVYIKMLLVGFFEGIESERGIAARCADSLSLRRFLHYDLTEATPHHSSFTVIRQRLSSEVYEKVFGLVLVALKGQKLLKGRRLAMDASVMEANASMRSLEHRLTGASYAEYVRTLAEAAGVDATDAAAVRRFDRKRAGKKTSNTEWQNPHEPDAKIGRTKRGATRMIYKPEHVVDLDTGAIVAADVRPGDEHDTAELKERVLEAERRLNAALGEEEATPQFQTLVGDKGYYKVEQLVALQELGLRTAISDPIDTRRLDRLSEEARSAVRNTKRTVQSKTGQALMRKRAELVERGFAQVLDHGGGRRTTLRGRDNIRKCYLIRAMGANLSLLMRTLTGLGTPKQALAASRDTVERAARLLQRSLLRSHRLALDFLHPFDVLALRLWLRPIPAR